MFPTELWPSHRGGGDGALDRSSMRRRKRSKVFPQSTQSGVEHKGGGSATDGNYQIVSVVDFVRNSRDASMG